MLKGEKMVLSGINITVMTIYICWNSHIIVDRIKKDGNKLTKISAAELLYTLIMFYLLVKLSPWFIFVTLATTIFHIVLGGAIEVFKPQMAATDIMDKFWAYLGIDVVISILSFVLLSSEV